jgi:hypothetical protein
MSRAPDKNRYIGYFTLSILKELGDLIFFLEKKQFHSLI